MDEVDIIMTNLFNFVWGFEIKRTRITQNYLTLSKIYINQESKPSWCIIQGSIP